MRPHPHYSLSRILTSMCFPNAFAYFSSINNVGILVPPSNLAIFDVLTPVISDNSCWVSFCLFPPPIDVSLLKNSAVLLIESYPHMPAIFSLFFPFHSDTLPYFFHLIRFLLSVLSNYIINDIKLKLQYLFNTLRFS